MNRRELLFGVGSALALAGVSGCSGKPEWDGSWEFLYANPELKAHYYESEMTKLGRESLEANLTDVINIFGRFNVEREVNLRLIDKGHVPSREWDWDLKFDDYFIPIMDSSRGDQVEAYLYRAIEFMQTELPILRPVNYNVVQVERPGIIERRPGNFYLADHIARTYHGRLVGKDSKEGLVIESPRLTTTKNQIMGLAYNKENMAAILAYGNYAFILPYSELISHTIYELAEEAFEDDGFSQSEAGETITESLALDLANKFGERYSTPGKERRIMEWRRRLSYLGPQYHQVERGFVYSQRVGMREALKHFMDDPVDYMKTVRAINV